MVESTTTERATRMLEHAAEVSAASAEAQRGALDELTDLTVGVAKEGAGLTGPRPRSRPAQPASSALSVDGAGRR